jgi:hypothetical protein
MVCQILFRGGISVGVQKVVKKIFTLGLEPSAWIGVDQIKENGGLISRLFSRLFSRRKLDDEHAQQRIQETFQQMVARQGMSTDDLKGRKRLAVILTFSYILVFFSLIAYSFYLFYLFSAAVFILSGLLFLILSALLLLNGLRENIVYYQLKYRRTNLSWSHWFKLTFTRFTL